MGHKTIVWKCAEDRCFLRKECCVLCLTDVGWESPSYFLNAPRHICAFDTFYHIEPFCVMRKGGKLKLRYWRCVLDDDEDPDVVFTPFARRDSLLHHHHEMFHNYYPKEQKERNIDYFHDGDDFYFFSIE